ncbi:MAG TPA: RNA methyltransferase [Polyangiaceae bacterium]|nr:RNA methyltransferase [Polyangiaceae bacterium]
MKEAPPRAAMLALAIHEHTEFVLVTPHYPENVGAVARAIKTMGFTRLTLVKPSRIASPEHEMARKMAVKSGDVLDQARRCATLAEALAERDLVVATTSRRGTSGARVPRSVAPEIEAAARAGRSVAIVLGNEKSGLTAEQLALAHERVRIPMAADQPSINLAQAAQILAYELFVAALEARARARSAAPR